MFKEKCCNWTVLLAGRKRTGNTNSHNNINWRYVTGIWSRPSKIFSIFWPTTLPNPEHVMHIESRRVLFIFLSFPLKKIIISDSFNFSSLFCLLPNSFFIAICRHKHFSIFQRNCPCFPNLSSEKVEIMCLLSLFYNKTLVFPFTLHMKETENIVIFLLCKWLGKLC